MIHMNLHPNRNRFTDTDKKLTVIKGGRREREIRSLGLAYTLPLAHLVKNLPVIQETRVRSLGWEVPLKKGMATHSSILAWTERLHFHFSLSCIAEENGNLLQYSCLENPMDREAWRAAVHGVARSRTRLSDFTFTFHFHALEKGMSIYSSMLAWRIPWTEKLGGLQSMVSQRVGHDRATNTHTYIKWTIDQNLLNSTGNYIQYSVTSYNIIGKKYVHIHVKVKHFTIYLKLIQYHKPTTL